MNIVTRGYGPGATIPLVVLRGYSAGAAAEVEETPSTAGLRARMLLELPYMMGGLGQADIAADWTGIFAAVGELGETATIAGADCNVISSTPYTGAFVGGLEVEGRITRLYVMAADFDDASAEHGSTVIFRAITYTIGRIERMDGGIVRLELMR